MVIASIADAWVELPELIEAVRRDEDVLIQREGQTVARLVRCQSERRRVASRE